MSSVVYRAPHRELNLNESNKSWWRNTQTLSRGLCVGEANIRRDTVKKKTAHSLLIKLAEVIEAATIFLFLSFLFYDHSFIDKGDLLCEIQGKWRRYSEGFQIRLLVD